MAGNRRFHATGIMTPMNCKEFGDDETDYDRFDSCIGDIIGGSQPGIGATADLSNQPQIK